MILESLVGLWLFQSMTQDGVEIPSNPAWELTFEFKENGINTLFYKRRDEEGFCQRDAVYEYQNNQLIQQVTWVHPDNAPWCSSDVDMQLGHKAYNKLVVNGNKMDLFIPFPGADIVYHWEKEIPPNP